jgi:gas vesicle protein
MNNKEILKQTIDFHKASFENCFSMMLMIQGQAEKLLKTFIDRTPGISEESKNVMQQWSSTYKKGIDDLKKAMDDGYAKFEAFIDNNATVMFQDQTEKMFNSYVNQVNWIPPDLKKTIEEFTATYKKGCEDFKKYVDENVWRMEKFTPDTKKPVTKKRK